jgi:hypothetical protein
MSETNIPLAGKDVTVTIKDADSPIQSYAVKLTEGTLTLIDGEYEELVALGMDGVPLSSTAPRQAGVRRRCGVVLNCKVFDAGDNAASITFPDIVKMDGLWATNFVSTTGTVETTMGTVHIDVLVADRGAIKGATYRFPDCRIQGNLQMEVSREGGFLVSGLEWQSTTTVKYTQTRTA